MEDRYKISPIGKVVSDRGKFSIQLKEELIPALTNIDGFKFLQIVWWGDKHDTKEKRSLLVYDKPYKLSPERLGVFATRSEVRPNPILITTIFVSQIDFEKGIIHTPYIDAFDDIDVLDIKPYHKVERIKNCEVPSWCEHWPDWYEEAGTFAWEDEFNF